MNKILLEVEHLIKSSYDIRFEMIHIVDEINELESSLDKLINELKQFRKEILSKIEKTDSEENCESDD